MRTLNTGSHCKSSCVGGAGARHWMACGEESEYARECDAYDDTFSPTSPTGRLHRVPLSPPRSRIRPTWDEHDPNVVVEPASQQDGDADDEVAG